MILDCLGEMTKSIVFCDLCVGNWILLVKSRLSRMSRKVFVSALSGLFIWIFKSPMMIGMPLLLMLASMTSISSDAKILMLLSGGLLIMGKCKGLPCNNKLKLVHSIVWKE